MTSGNCKLARHSSQHDCWVVIHGRVYDLTQFLPEHPGGAGTILMYAGKDASEAFDSIHSPDVIDKALPPSAFLGEIEGPVPTLGHALETADAVRQRETQAAKPRLDEILNLREFEPV